MPEHTHWTDYVPDKIKQAFDEAAASVPLRHKAKMKTPFERLDPFPVYDKRKGRLLRKTRAELETAESAGDMAKVDKLHVAIHLINNAPPRAHLPDTWHGMFDRDY